MRTKIEQEAARREELAAIEAELKALAARAMKAEASTVAYLITMAANTVREERTKP